VLLAATRTSTIAAAAKFAAGCGKAGASWHDAWPRIKAGCYRAGVELSGEERMALYEAWDAAYPWPEEVA
jgi:hypothetical protein